MKTPCVELVYFPGCPHVGTTREALRAALAAEELAIEWREWNRDDPATPAALRGYGSPTVLVNGRDVAPAQADAECCRLYQEAGELHPAPGTTTLRAALRDALTPTGKSR